MSIANLGSETILRAESPGDERIECAVHRTSARNEVHLPARSGDRAMLVPATANPSYLTATDWNRRRSHVRVRSSGGEHSGGTRRNWSGQVDDHGGGVHYIGEEHDSFAEHIGMRGSADAAFESPPPYTETTASGSVVDGETIAFGSMPSVWSGSTGQTPQNQEDRSTLRSIERSSQYRQRQSSLQHLLLTLERDTLSDTTESTAPSLPTPLFEPVSLNPWDRPEFFPPTPPSLLLPPRSRPASRPLTLGHRRAALEIAIPPRKSTGVGMPSARKLLSPESAGTPRVSRAQVQNIRGVTPKG